MKKAKTCDGEIELGRDNLNAMVVSASTDYDLPITKCSGRPAFLVYHMKFFGAFLRVWLVITLWVVISKKWFCELKLNTRVRPRQYFPIEMIYV